MCCRAVVRNTKRRIFAHKIPDEIIGNKACEYAVILVKVLLGCIDSLSYEERTAFFGMINFTRCVPVFLARDNKRDKTQFCHELIFVCFYRAFVFGKQVVVANELVDFRIVFKVTVNIQGH